MRGEIIDPWIPNPHALVMKVAITPPSMGLMMIRIIKSKGG
jgi:hypothetical protein